MWMRSTKMYVDVRCSPLDAARALVTRYLWIPPERAIGTASSRQDKADRCSKITLQKELPISNRYWCFSEMWFTSTSVMLNRCTAACEWNKNCSTVVTCNYNTAFLLVINNCMIQISIEKDGNSYFPLWRSRTWQWKTVENIKLRLKMSLAKVTPLSISISTVILIIIDYYLLRFLFYLNVLFVRFLSEPM